MLVRCWGARGSIAVSGAEYDKYGGDTTCIEVRTGNDEIIIVDAGSGVRRLGNLLVREGRHEYTFLFTHSHWDHILGFPFFKPIYFAKTHIALYGCPLSQGNIEKLLARTMLAPYFPVPYVEKKAQIDYMGKCPDGLIVDTVKISSIPLSHPNQGLGFKFTEGDKTFVFLTDNEPHHPHVGGRSVAEYVEFSRGADLLIHDAEYEDEEYQFKKGWGHTMYLDALELALEAGVKRFGLYHHNQDRGDQGVDAMVEDCRRIVAERGRDLDCFGVTQTSEFVL